MVRLFAISLLMLVMLGAGLATANDERVAVVDMDRIFASIKVVDSLKESLKERLEIYKIFAAKQIEEIKKSERDLKRRLQKTNINASKHQESHIDLVKKMQERIKSKRSEVDKYYSDGVRSVKRMISREIEQYAREKNIQIVHRAKNLVYFEPKFDISDKVVLQINGKYTDIRNIGSDIE